MASWFYRLITEGGKEIRVHVKADGHWFSIHGPANDEREIIGSFKYGDIEVLACELIRSGDLL